MKNIVIIGAGGFGREMLAWVRQSTGLWPVKGFLDDNPRALDGFAKNVPVLGGTEDFEPGSEDLFVCALGRVERRRGKTRTKAGPARNAKKAAYTGYFDAAKTGCSARHAFTGEICVGLG